MLCPRSVAIVRLAEQRVRFRPVIPQVPADDISRVVERREK